MNPFSYPKSKHTRRFAPKQYKRYRTYKHILKLEFDGLCIYCRLPMSMKGNESFSVDHYRPKSQFPELECFYPNLYYCCNTCNSHKNNYWPNSGAQEKTHFIPNPCDHVMFDHLQYNNARVISKSLPGRVAEEVLDLNDPESISFRDFIIETIATWTEKKAGLENMRKKAQKKMGKNSPTTTAQAIIEIDNAIAICERNLRRLGGRM